MVSSNETAASVCCGEGVEPKGEALDSLVMMGGSWPKERDEPPPSGV